VSPSRRPARFRSPSPCASSPRAAPTPACATRRTSRPCGWPWRPGRASRAPSRPRRLRSNAPPDRRRHPRQAGGGRPRPGQDARPRRRRRPAARRGGLQVHRQRRGRHPPAPRLAGCARHLSLPGQGEGHGRGWRREPPAARAAGPKVKHDTIRPDGEIGDVAVYAEGFEVVARLQRPDPAAREVLLVADYQGCAERGICYPPQKARVKLQLPAAGPGTARPRSCPAPPRTGPGGRDRRGRARRRAGPDRGHAAARQRLARPSPASSASACCSPSRPACSR